MATNHSGSSSAPLGIVSALSTLRGIVMIERRNFGARAAVLDCVTKRVLRNPAVMVTFQQLGIWCKVPIEAAQRILTMLVRSGVVREIQQGVFTLSVWPGTERLWSTQPIKPRDIRH